MKNLINQNSVTTLETLHKGKENNKLALSALANARSALFSAQVESIELPAEHAVINQMDGKKVEVDLRAWMMQYLTLAASGFDSATANLPYGCIKKGFLDYEAWSTMVRVIATPAERAKPVQLPTTPEQWLIFEIKANFEARKTTLAAYYADRIAELQEQCKTELQSVDDSLTAIVNSETLPADYLAMVETGNGVFQLDGETVTLDKTYQAIQTAKFEEKIEQVRSTFVGTKMDIYSEFADGKLVIDIQNYDAAAVPAINDKLTAFGLPNLQVAKPSTVRIHGEQVTFATATIKL